MYAQGQGVPQDHAEAAKWFRRAAEQGLVDAQYRVGLGYYQGHGVPKNIVQAYMWWTLAGLKGHRKADDHRERAARHMTATQILEAMKLAGKPQKGVKKPLCPPSVNSGHRISGETSRAAC
jgi:TPR repeat protein